MRSHKHSARLDSLGMTASLLCAIHCAALPLLLTVLPLVGLSFLANPWVEWGMIGLAIVLGLWSIGSSYYNTHRRLLPSLMLCAGFLIIIVGHALFTGWQEGVVVPLGGMTIAAAHFVNYRYVGMCKNPAHVH